MEPDYALEEEDKFPFEAFTLHKASINIDNVALHNCSQDAEQAAIKID